MDTVGHTYAKLQYAQLVGTTGGTTTVCKSTVGYTYGRQNFLDKPENIFLTLVFQISTSVYDKNSGKMYAPGTETRPFIPETTC